jgi:UDP-N-acetylmuramate dehydrogenase
VAAPLRYDSIPDPLVELQRRLGSSVRVAESLARLTSIRTGGPADLFLFARSQSQIMSAVDTADELGVPWQVIGSASNLLIADEGVDGLVIKAGMNATPLTSKDQDGPLIEAEAGCIFASVAKRSALAGLAGLEWAVNVPGTIGASVVNNAGAFGSSTAEHLIDADVYVPGEGVVRVSVEDLRMSYRSTRLKRGELRGVVLRARYRLQSGDAMQLRSRIEEIQRQRRATQPSGYSVGSVFTNPPGDAAGRIVESLGLKGYRIGGAEVSRLHANFMLNCGGATSRDVWSLIRHVQDTVGAATGISLVPEIQLFGRWSHKDVTVLQGPSGEGG